MVSLLTIGMINLKCLVFTVESMLSALIIGDTSIISIKTTKTKIGMKIKTIKLDLKKLVPSLLNQNVSKPGYDSMELIFIINFYQLVIGFYNFLNIYFLLEVYRIGCTSSGILSSNWSFCIRFSLVVSGDNELSSTLT